MQSVFAQRILLISPPGASAGPTIENSLRDHGFETVQVGSLQEAEKYGRPTQARLMGVILDLTNWSAGMTIVRDAREILDDRPVLVISDDPNVASVSSAMRNGAADYLMMPLGDDKLVRCVETMMCHRPSAWMRIDPPAAPAGISQLTRCERRVLEGVLSAKTTKQISSELQIGLQTVAKHKQRVLRKLGARNDVALVLQILAGRQTLPPQSINLSRESDS